MLKKNYFAFRTAIYTLRKRVKMNQQEMASIMGISSNTLSRWENDNNPRIDVEALNRLCKHFDLSLDEFLRGRLTQTTSLRGSRLFYIISASIVFVLIGLGLFVIFYSKDIVTYGAITITYNKRLITYLIDYYMYIALGLTFIVSIIGLILYRWRLFLNKISKTLDE